MKKAQSDKSVQVKVHQATTTVVTREADPDEQYDGDDKSHSHEFYGYSVYPMKAKTYWDFVLPTDPKKADLYFVYVLHTQGDSFHYEDGCLCSVGLYSNLEDAIKVRDAIKNDAAAKSADYESSRLKLELSDGSVTDIYTGTWMGYFERFESVHIETLRFNPND